MRGVWFTDAHVLPDEDLSRFSRLGRYLVQAQPDIIVQGGDFVTLDSFSRWDKDKRLKIENRRYKKDIYAANDAIRELITPIEEYNRKRREFKEKQYRPDWIWFQGNHEYWVDEYVMRNPELEGAISIKDDLNLSDLPGTVRYLPYRNYDWFYERLGVYFCHVPRNRAGPISSKYIADRALEVFDGSVIFGHTHRLLFSTCRRVGSNYNYQALCGGCFFENDPEYAVGNNNDYWRGIIDFRLLGNGRFGYNVILKEEL